jgi:polysaccharide chain length determinant protein (PEP-CTERM system associated)
MQGAAVQTEVVDRAKIAREIVYGRDILVKILKKGGWLEGNPSPVKREQLIDGLRSRLEIKNARANLLRFTYKDTDPERTYKTLSTAVDLFISQSLASKLAESRSAYEFIDKQVSQYHAKLRSAEEQLKKFRSANVDIRSGSIQEIANRIQTLQARVSNIEQELRETKIKKKTLLAQLSGEAETAAGLSRAEEYRKRIIELQTKLDNLLLNYHETYPDVVRAREQIEELKNALKQEEQNKNKKSSGNTIIIEGVEVDERIQASPVYQQLRTDLYATNSKIQTLTSRLADARRSLKEQEALGRRTHELQATLAELERDYQVNSDIYQDFLRRREAARVSMNVDLEKKGLNLRVDEPPFLPLSPSGLGLADFVMAGMLAGLVLPIGVLFGILQIDPRIRNAEQLNEISDIPIIGVVNEYYADAELQEIQKNYISIFLLGLLTVVAVIVAALFYR